MIYIRDDNGYAWYFDGERIRCREADGFPDNGYPCGSLEEGIRFLNEHGYISGNARRRKTENKKRRAKGK